MPPPLTSEMNARQAHVGMLGVRGVKEREISVSSSESDNREESMAKLGAIAKVTKDQSGRKCSEVVGMKI